MHVNAHSWPVALTRSRVQRGSKHATDSAPAVPCHPEADWIELVRRVADGDRDALATLYDATTHLVFGLALRIVGERSAAEDVAVEVYTHVWQRAQDYSAVRGTPSAWLHALTRSRAIDTLRARRRHRATEPLEAAAQLASETPDPEDASVAAERQRYIHGALQRLGAAQREAIELAYFSGLSHSEIAARLGEPLGTVKTRIRLGMLRLQTLLVPVLSSPVPTRLEKTA